MKRRRRQKSHASHERWLVSYADFITLMFAFFVVMYSAAQVDRRKIGQLALAMQAAFQKMGALPGAAALPNMPAQIPAAPEPIPKIGDEGAELNTLQKELEKALAMEISRREVELHLAPDGLVISLREVGFFDSGSAVIRPSALPAFDRIVSVIAPTPHRLRIEGHTDTIPIHNTQFASNWELSTARATQLVRLLITQYGFAPERLSAAGFAQYHPVAGNETAEGRAQNRRVDLVILGKTSATSKP